MQSMPSSLPDPLRTWGTLDSPYFVGRCLYTLNRDHSGVCMRTFLTRANEYPFIMASVSRCITTQKVFVGVVPIDVIVAGVGERGMSYNTTG